MSAPAVVVVKTGAANLASVLAGLQRAGAEPTLSDDPQLVSEAPYVVLPGVGAFGAAVERLQEYDLLDVLRSRVQNGHATLCICLGMQLLAEASEESPGVPGLGVIPGLVRRFTEIVRVPQLGWNQVEPQGDLRLLESGYAYFANSYCLLEPPAGWGFATAEHGGHFVAAIERGDVLACQFHPELSGAWGLGLLRRWLC